MKSLRRKSKRPQTSRITHITEVIDEGFIGIFQRQSPPTWLAFLHDTMETLPVKPQCRLLLRHGEYSDRTLDQLRWTYWVCRIDQNNVKLLFGIGHKCNTVINDEFQTFIINLLGSLWDVLNTSIDDHLIDFHHPQPVLHLHGEVTSRAVPPSPPPMTNTLFGFWMNKERNMNNHVMIYKLVSSPSA